jgi:phosphoserine phosphatase
MCAIELISYACSTLSTNLLGFALGDMKRGGGGMHQTKTSFLSDQELRTIKQKKSNVAALFLDVDETLTNGPIQSYYAKEFGYYEKLLAIEEKFQTGKISSQQFGEAVTPLMREHGFTWQANKHVVDKVILQPWTTTFLENKNADIYLVSSGPSFYIDWLANRFNIPNERVLCTRYFFDPNTGVILDQVNAISGAHKGAFVERVSKLYLLSAGVGDNAASDGQFIAHCTVGFLTQPNENYLYAPNLSLIAHTLSRLTRTFTASCESVGDNGSVSPSPFVDAGRQRSDRPRVHLWWGIVIFAIVALAFSNYLGAEHDVAFWQFILQLL